MTWLRRRVVRWLQHVHAYELELPEGQRELQALYVGDELRLYSPGGVTPSITVERLSAVRTRITIRNDDERLTEEDLTRLTRGPQELVH